MPRRSKPLTAEQKSLVASVRRISKQRARINLSYISAIVKARAAGVTFAVIAEAAGMSSQAAQEIVRRHTKDGSDGSNASSQDDEDPAHGPSGGGYSRQSGVPEYAAAVRQDVGTYTPSE